MVCELLLLHPHASAWLLMHTSISYMLPTSLLLQATEALAPAPAPAPALIAAATTTAAVWAAATAATTPAPTPLALTVLAPVLATTTAATTMAPQGLEPAPTPRMAQTVRPDS